MFNFWNFNEQKELNAKYIGFIREVGAFKKPVYCFELDNKKRVHIWASAMLINKLQGIPHNTRVAITFLGKFKTDGNKYEMLQFDVKFLGDAVPEYDNTSKSSSETKKSD
jgi:hypothetical protein